MTGLRPRLEDRFPLVAAHRGASRLAPENTMAAFERAVQLGARAIELDVQLTADGEAVVIHDATVDRTTDGHGRVSDLARDAVTALDAGAWFGAAFAGERIPRLAEVLDWARSRVFLNIELKPATGDDDALAAKVAGLVRATGMTDGCLAMSFDHVAVERFKVAAPSVPALVIAGARLFREIPYVRSVGADGSNHSPAWWTAPTCAAFRAAGLVAHASLVNEAAAWAQAVDRGVDMVDTDEPALFGGGDA